MLEFYKNNPKITNRMLLYIIISQLIFFIVVRGGFLNVAISAQNFNLDSDVYERITLINNFILNYFMIFILFSISFMFFILNIAIKRLYNATYVFILFFLSLLISIPDSYFILNTFVTRKLTYFRYPTISYHLVVITIILCVFIFLLLNLLTIYNRKEAHVKDNKLKNKY